MANDNSVGELFANGSLLARISIVLGNKRLGSGSSGSNDSVVLGIALDLKNKVKVSNHVLIGMTLRERPACLLQAHRSSRKTRV